MYSGGKLGQADFFAVELFDAVPYLVVDFGDRVHRFMLGRDARRVSDGSAHHVKVRRSEETLILRLDDDEKSVDIISASPASLDLGNDVVRFRLYDTFAIMPEHISPVPYLTGKATCHPASALNFFTVMGFLCGFCSHSW